MIWEARKHAKYIDAVENRAGANPITLWALHRNYKPFSSQPLSYVHGWLSQLGPGLGRTGGLYHQPQVPSASRRRPAVTACSDSDWIGAPVPRTTQERSAHFTTLSDWFVMWTGPPPLWSGVWRMKLITTEYSINEYSIKPRRNKPLIQRVACLLTAVRSHYNVAISWNRAHTGLTTPEAVANAHRTACSCQRQNWFLRRDGGPPSST